MSDASDLVGSWESDMADPYTRRTIGKIRMEFYPDQTLAYVTFEQAKMQIIKLVYKVADDVIITDQLSHPDEQRARFELSEPFLRVFDGLDYAVFKRVGG